MSQEEFNFDSNEFNEDQIIFEEAAKKIIPVYRAFRAQGLSVQEAAALVAAMTSQTMPFEPPEPADGQS